MDEEAAATVTIRRGRVDDAAGLRALGEAVVPATYASLDPAYAELMLTAWWSPDRLAESLEVLPHWVAEAGDGSIIGVANLGEHEGSSTLWKLYVHPDQQGQGLGNRLLDEVLSANGDRSLELEVVDGNHAAEEFYRRRGFSEFRRTPERAHPSITLIWMRRPPRG